MKIRVNSDERKKNKRVTKTITFKHPYVLLEVKVKFTSDKKQFCLSCLIS